VFISDAALAVIQDVPATQGVRLEASTRGIRSATVARQPSATLLGRQ